MSELIYQWEAGTGRLRLRLQGLQNHELRCLLLGLWRRMDADDQRDFMEELAHYCGRPDSELPPLSRAIAAAMEAPRGDLSGPG